MGFDPNEPRDKSGKWTGASSGHNAGGGNRDIAKKVIADHQKASATDISNFKSMLGGTITPSHWPSQNLNRGKNQIEIRSGASGAEISRKSASGGMVNLGRQFTPDEVAKIKDFVDKADGYLSWDKHWKPFLRKLK